MTYRHYVMCLSLSFLVEWVILAIDPYDRADWALENVLVIVAVIALLLINKWFRISRLSFTLIFIFLGLHIIGAHFTYAKVPYNDWITYFFGFDTDELFGWQRNQFDRIVHFLFGALLFHPLRELLTKASLIYGVWRYIFPLMVIMSLSMVFELIEWFAAWLFGGDLGVAYLGTQGDEWDAQKDMALATIGGLAVFSFLWIKERALHSMENGVN